MQFRHLIALAQNRGTAVAIGHPYPQTLSVLQNQLPNLKKYGVELISVSALIERTKYINAFLTTTRMLASRPVTSATIEPAEPR